MTDTDTDTADRIKFNGRHLVEDPHHMQVCFRMGGRDLLGDVIGVYFDDVTGCVRLRVRHFNGEVWPCNPPAREVTVLRR